MQFRVAQTAGASHVASEFGYHPGNHGRLTAEMVNHQARQAKALAHQKTLAAAMNKHLAKTFTNKAEIEKLTLEAIEKGLESKEQIDKYVVEAVVAGAKHNTHLQKLAQQVQQDLQLVNAEMLSSKAIASQSFQQRLQLLAAGHQAKQVIQISAFQAKLKEIQASPLQAIQMQQQKTRFNDYINAKDFDPEQGVRANTQGDKGMLGNIRNFFAGKR